MIKYFLITMGIGITTCLASDRYSVYYDNFYDIQRKQQTKIPNFHLIYGGENYDNSNDIGQNNKQQGKQVIQAKRVIIGNHAFLISNLQGYDQKNKKNRDQSNLQNNQTLQNIDEISEKVEVSDPQRSIKTLSDKEIFLSYKLPDSDNLFFRRDISLNRQILQKSPEEIFYDQAKQGAYYLLQEILRNSFDGQDVLKVVKDLIKGTTEFAFSKLNQSGTIPDSVYDEIYKQLNASGDLTQVFKEVSKCSAFFVNLGQKVGDQLVISHQLNDTQKLLISTGFTTVGQIFGNIVPIVFRQAEVVEQGISNSVNNLLGRIMGCCTNDNNVVRE